MGSSWDSCWAHFGSWSAQVGHGTVFEPSYLRKSDCSRNHSFYKGLGRFWAQDGAPKRPKIAPRRVQDRLGSLFLPLRFSLRFLIVLGSVLVPFWPPKWRPGGPKRAPKRSPKTTKKRSENRCKKRSHVRTVSRPTWGDLGPILVPSWGQEGQKSKKSGCGSNAVHFFKKKWLWLENWAWATTVLEPQPPF